MCASRRYTLRAIFFFAASVRHVHTARSCALLSRTGTNNEAFMRSGCARSCGFCKGKTIEVEAEDDDLLDDDFMKDEL
jgi:ShK domain-like.